MLSRHAVASALLLSSALASQAYASDYLAASIGYFDVVRHKDTATQFGLEYRFEPIAFGVRPTVGISATTDSAWYGYGGLNWDVQIGKSPFYLTPNFMIGAYSQGDGRKLGGALEFRSGVEVSYQFQNAHRVGVAFNHISNAGIYDRNPGTETILLNYAIPTGTLITW